MSIFNNWNNKVRSIQPKIKKILGGCSIVLCYLKHIVTKKKLPLRTLVLSNNVKSISVYQRSFSLVPACFFLVFESSFRANTLSQKYNNTVRKKQIDSGGLRINRRLLKCDGFTLIELLIALFLSSLLLLGIVQIFSASRTGIESQNELSKIQDSARIAMEFLSRDIKSADFTGCLSDKSKIENLLLPIGSYDDNVHPYFSLGGLNAYSAKQTSELGNRSIKIGTDVLQIVGSEPICANSYELTENTDTLAPLTLRNDCEIDDGTVLLVTNCEAGNIFVKTGGNSNSIEHSTASTDGLQNRQDRLTTIFGADASLLKPFVHTYFISDGIDGNDALFLRDNGRNFELVSNVSDINLLFGVDADLNGAPDDFVESVDINTLDVRAIVSVRIELIAEGARGLISREYISTISIRNRMVPAYLLSLSNTN